MSSNKPLIVEADIRVEEETAYLKERAASFISLPEEEDRQIDLMYFTAIYVSSGENLNHAYFQPVELVAAEGSIIHKALDVEHKEKEVVGHLYDRVFINEKGEKLSVDDLKALDKDDLNEKNIHVAIAGIIYKHRFPEVAQEVAEGKWKVSMEVYYEDFDIKIGDTIITRKEAESVGYTDISKVLGKKGRLVKSGREIANGTISRVLRNLKFAGCGLVENPANPPSVILEVATCDDNNVTSNTSSEVNDFTSKDDEVIINIEDNNVTSDKLGEASSEESQSDDSGVCVYYKKRVTSKTGEILHEDWCSKFDTKCTSFSRTVDDPDCLLRQVSQETAKYVKRSLNNRSIERELSALEKLLNRK